MPAPSARAIYESSEQAIYDLVVDGKSQASFQGRQYTAINLMHLESIRDYYRARALALGEITSDSTTGRVAVSFMRMTDEYGTDTSGRTETQ